MPPKKSRKRKFQSLPGNLTTSDLDKSSFKYSTGEKHNCQWIKGSKSAVYEAKILEVRINKKSGNQEYKIHYEGWNKRHDEWILEKMVNVDENGEPLSTSTTTTNNRSNTTNTNDHSKSQSVDQLSKSLITVADSVQEPETTNDNPLKGKPATKKRKNNLEIESTQVAQKRPKSENETLKIEKPKTKVTENSTDVNLPVNQLKAMAIDSPSKIPIKMNKITCNGVKSPEVKKIQATKPVKVSSQVKSPERLALRTATTTTEQKPSPNIPELQFLNEPLPNSPNNSIAGYPSKNIIAKKIQLNGHGEKDAQNHKNTTHVINNNNKNKNKNIQKRERKTIFEDDPLEDPMKIVRKPLLEVDENKERALKKTQFKDEIRPLIDTILYEREVYHPDLFCNHTIKGAPIMCHNHKAIIDYNNKALDMISHIVDSKLFKMYVIIQTDEKTDYAETWEFTSSLLSEDDRKVRMNNFESTIYNLRNLCQSIHNKSCEKAYKIHVSEEDQDNNYKSFDQEAWFKKMKSIDGKRPLGNKVHRKNLEDVIHFNRTEIRLAVSYNYIED